MAAKGIAKKLSGDESKRTESDLLKLLKLQVVETNLAKEGKALSKKHLALDMQKLSYHLLIFYFSSILGDMKVVKEDRDFKDYMPSQRKVGVQDGERPPPRYQPQRQKVRFEDSADQESVSRSFLNRQIRPRDTQRPVSGTVGLFIGEGLGIFEPNIKESPDLPKLQIWDRLMQDELEYVMAQPPKNAFDEMIKLTEDGKLWKYPINNEQGRITLL